MTTVVTFLVAGLTVTAGLASADGCDTSATPVVWTGGTAGDWNTGTNWDGGSSPTSDQNVVVPSSAVIDNVSGAVCKLTLGGGSEATPVITLNGTGTPLQVHADLVATGGTDGAASFTLPSGVVLAGPVQLTGGSASASGTTLALPGDATLTGALSVVAGTAGTTTVTAAGSVTPASLRVQGGPTAATAATVKGDVATSGTALLAGVVDLSDAADHLDVGTVLTVGDGTTATNVTLPADLTIGTELDIAAASADPTTLTSAVLVQAPALAITGGADPGQLITVNAALDISGSATLAGYVKSSGGLTVEGVFSLLQAGRLFLDGDASDIVAGSTVNLGSGSAIGTTSGAPTLAPAGKVVLTGGNATLTNVALDLNPTATPDSGVIDPNGHTLTVAGSSTSTWPNGSLISTLASSGAVSFGSSAHLVLGGTTTITSPAHLALDGDTAQLSPSGQTATLAGSGTFDWNRGTVLGQLSLGSNLTTSLGDNAVRVLDAGAVLTNNGTFHGADTGTLQIDGTLDNQGSARFLSGSHLTGSGTLINRASKMLEVEAGGLSLVTMTGLTLENHGKIKVASRRVLRLVNSQHSTLQGPDSIEGGGALEVGAGSTLTLSGSTTFVGGGPENNKPRPSVLRLEDGSGNASATIASNPSAPATLLGATTTDGTLHWCSGTIKGALTVGVVTEVGLGVFGGQCASTTANPVLLGDATHKAVLTVNAAASINKASLSLRPHSQLVLAGSTSIGGNQSGIDHGPSAINDESVIVRATGSLRVAPMSVQTADGTTSQNAQTTALIDVPFVNNGTMTVDTSPLRIGGGVVTNRGTVTVKSATLTVPGGYTQSAPTSTTPTPPTLLTGLTGTNSLLTTSNGASPAQFGAVNITKGGIGGVGKIVASTVSMGNAWVHPGLNGAPGLLTLDSALKLSSGSDVRIAIYPPATGSTNPRHDVLKVTKAATLAGRVTGLTDSSYTAEKYLAIAYHVITYSSHSGSFTSASWSVSSASRQAGYGWRPRPASSTGVSLQLVDVQAPALGIAGVSAFTELTSQRVTYVGIDNKTGVQSYDVRWRVAPPNQAYSSWRYPASWQNTTVTSQTLTGLVVGYSYCFSVRVRDKVGNVSAWSVPWCTTKMFDDRALTASSGWTRRTNQAGYYYGSFTQSSSYGRTLTRSGTYNRIGVMLYRCPTCGTVNIYAGSTLVKSLSLRSSTTGLFSYISGLMPLRTGTVSLKVVSHSGLVRVDAFGLQR